MNFKIRLQSTTNSQESSFTLPCNKGTLEHERISGFNFMSVENTNAHLPLISCCRRGRSFIVKKTIKKNLFGCT